MADITGEYITDLTPADALDGSEEFPIAQGASPAVKTTLDDIAAYIGSPDIQALLDTIGDTQGDVLYRGAAGWSVLAPGTAGNVLTTGGAGEDPSWTAPASGGGGLPLTRALVPELSTWTTLNATGASFAEKTASDGLTRALQITSVTGSGVSAPNFQGLYRAAPTPPYRVVCGFFPPAAYTQFPSFQFGFYDGTKLMTIALDQSTNGDGSRVTVVLANNVTTPGSEPFTSANGPMSYRNFPPMFAWYNDGTTLQAQWTSDGVYFDTFWQQNISGGHLANQNSLCAVVNTYQTNGKKAVATIFEWDVDGLNRTLNNVNFGG